MKKFILLIAVITLSFGSVWAENYNAVKGSDADTNVPFNTTSTDSQHIQIIYPSSLFFGKMSDNASDFLLNNISGIKFTASNEISLPQNVTYTITLKQVNKASFTSLSFESISGITANYTSSNPTVTNTESEYSITFSFTSVFNYSYSSNAGSANDILVDIVITPNSATAGNSTSWKTTNTTQNNVIYKGSSNIEYGNYPNTTFICGRTIETTYNSSKYRINTENSSNLSADLYKGSIVASKYYYTYSPSFDFNTPQLKQTNLVVIPETFNLPFFLEEKENRPVSVSTINKYAFSQTIVQNNIMVWIPDDITIGESNCDNKCFYFDIRDDEGGLGGTTKYYVYVAFYSHDGHTHGLPTVKGSSFENFTTTKSNEKRVYLYLHDKYGTTDDIFTTWNPDGNTGTNLINSFAGTGWISYPFIVNIQNSYGNDIDISKIASVSSMPYKTNPLTFAIINSYGSHDASWHYYHSIQSSGTSITGANAITGYDSNGMSYILTGISSATLKTKCYAQFEYNHGDPYFDIAEDLGKINNHNIFNGCDSVTFKEYVTIDNVPYFKLRNDNGSTKTLNTSADIHIEKKINSTNFRYFSLPYRCQVSKITAMVTSVNGTDVTPYGMTFLNTDYKTASRTTKDHFVILKYIASDSTIVKNEGSENEVHEYGHARYHQVLNSADYLEPNQGYAVAIFESSEHNSVNVEGLITFKTGTETKTLNTWDNPNTFNPGDYPEVVCDEKDTSQKFMPIAVHNQGYRMVGNPYFNYVWANAYSTKYIRTIDANSATTPHNTEIETSIKIKPFEAFFVKLTNHNEQITVTSTQDANPTYSEVTGLPPMNMARATVDERPEHISVSLRNANGSKDRTTVINKDYVNEHFNNEEDLSKGFASGNLIYSYYDDIEFAFKALPLRLDSTFIVPLGVRLTQGGNYTIALDTTLTMFWGATMLHDKQENKYYTLDANGINFNLNPGTNNGRFELVIVPSEIPAELEDVQTSETLDAYVHDGHLVVENIAEGSNLSIYDISGKLVYSADASGDFNYNFSARGVYMVVLRGNTTGSIKVVY